MVYASFVKLPCTIFCSRSKCFHGTLFSTSIRYVKVGKMGTAAALPSSNCDNFINFRTHSKAPSVFRGLLDSYSNHELLASATPSLYFFKTFFILINTNFDFDSRNSGGVNNPPPSPKWFFENFIF